MSNKCIGCPHSRKSAPDPFNFACEECFHGQDMDTRYSTGNGYCLNPDDKSDDYYKGCYDE